MREAQERIHAKPTNTSWECNRSSAVRTYEARKLHLKSPRNQNHLNPLASQGLRIPHFRPTSTNPSTKPTPNGAGSPAAPSAGKRAPIRARHRPRPQNPPKTPPPKRGAKPAPIGARIEARRRRGRDRLRARGAGDAESVAGRLLEPPPPLARSPRLISAAAARGRGSDHGGGRLWWCGVVRLCRVLV
jgi:hypothetical protein